MNVLASLRQFRGVDFLEVAVIAANTVNSMQEAVVDLVAFYQCKLGVPSLQTYLRHLDMNNTAQYDDDLSIRKELLYKSLLKSVQSS